VSTRIDKIFLSLFLIVLGCTGNNINIDGIDKNKIVKEAQNIMLEHKDGGFIDDYPYEISKLNPKSIYVNDLGLFIVKDECFAEESGLFIPHNENFNEQINNEPEFIEISDQLFKYKIKG
jgi:hypothetical protein